MIRSPGLLAGTAPDVVRMDETDPLEDVERGALVDLSDGL